MVSPTGYDLAILIRCPCSTGFILKRSHAGIVQFEKRCRIRLMTKHQMGVQQIVPKDKYYFKVACLLKEFENIIANKIDTGLLGRRDLSSLRC